MSWYICILGMMIKKEKHIYFTLKPFWLCFFPAMELSYSPPLKRISWMKMMNIVKPSGKCFDEVTKRGWRWNDISINVFSLQKNLHEDTDCVGSGWKNIQHEWSTFTWRLKWIQMWFWIGRKGEISLVTLHCFHEWEWTFCWLVQLCVNCSHRNFRRVLWVDLDSGEIFCMLKTFSITDNTSSWSGFLI